MSLVASLFGEAAKESGDPQSNESGLFDKKVSIPEKRKPKSRPEAPTDPADDNDHHELATISTAAAAPIPDDNPKGPIIENDVGERTIFVGNLPPSYVQRKRQLLALFQDCGPISSARFRSVATTGVKVQQKGNQSLVQKVCVNTNLLDTSTKQSVSAYIVFEKASSVEAALAKNNMELPAGDTPEGQQQSAVRHIRVDRATPTYEPTKSVFVGNLPYEADEESLAAYFRGQQRLPVQAVRIVRDKQTHQCKGFGYVLFSDKSSVAKALNFPNDTTNYMGRKLRVQVCGKRYKSQNSSSDSTERPEPKKRKLNESGAVGALRRVLAKQPEQKKKRARSEKGRSNKPGGAGSKRAAVQAKTNQRIKKLEKRISKGMGKARKAK